MHSHSLIHPTQPPPSRGPHPRLTSLPAPCWRLLISHLHSKRSLFNCSVVCSGFVRVADELATDLKGIAAPDLPRALQRFDRATRVSIQLPAQPHPHPQPTPNTPCPSASRPGPNLECQGFGTGEASSPRIVSNCNQHEWELRLALRSVSPQQTARITALVIRGYPAAAGALADSASQASSPAVTAAGGDVTSRWHNLRRLELADCGVLNWLEVGRAAGALTNLRHLVIRGVTASGPAWPAAEGRLFDRLTDLELVGFAPEASKLLGWHLPQLGKLRRLVVEDMPGLDSLSLDRLPGLQVRVGGLSLPYFIL